MSLISKIQSSFKNVHFQSLLGNGVMAIFGLLTFAILFRALSVNDIGLYFYLLIFYNLVDTIKAGFLTNSFITFYAGTSEDRRNEVAGSSWTIAILISAGLIILNIPVYFIAGYFRDYSIQLYLKYFSIFAVSTLPSFMANLVVQGERRFDRLFWLRLINQLLFIGSIILLMVLKKATFTTVMVAFTITNFMTSFILIPMGWTKIYSIKHTTRSMLIELFHFGKYSVGTSLSTNLFRVTDSLFIQNFLGAPALAIYNLGSKWMPVVEIPMLSFAASGIPILASHYNNGEKDDMVRVMEKLVGMLTFAILIIALVAIIFANPLVLLMGGNKYIGSAAPNLLRLFMSTAILFPTDRFFAMTIDVIKKPYINFYKLIAMVVINLIGDFVSVTVFHSLYAVVITNFLPLIAAIIITYIPLQKNYRFNFFNMYIIGYKEVIVLIRNFYNSLFNKTEVVSN
jgi:O-antigen/teichoic acid export membrane protein